MFTEKKKLSYITHHGMSRPIFVHLLLVMKNPTMGSVTAPQALPTNNTIEAWNGLICQEKTKWTSALMEILIQTVVRFLLEVLY